MQSLRVRVYRVSLARVDFFVTVQRGTVDGWHTTLYHWIDPITAYARVVSHMQHPRYTERGLQGIWSADRPGSETVESGGMLHRGHARYGTTRGMLACYFGVVSTKISK